MLKLAQARCSSSISPDNSSVILHHDSAWLYILLHLKVHRVSRWKGHEKEPCQALCNSCRVNASHVCRKGPESCLVLWFKVILLHFEWEKNLFEITSRCFDWFSKVWSSPFSQLLSKDSDLSLIGLSQTMTDVFHFYFIFIFLCLV